MVAVTKVNVGGTRFVPLDKTTRTWPRKSVRGFVVDRRIRFHLDDDSGAIAPDQFRADEVACATDRIALKKWTANKLFPRQRGRSLHIRLKYLPLCKRLAMSLRIRLVCRPETRERISHP